MPNYDGWVYAAMRAWADKHNKLYPASIPVQIVKTDEGILLRRGNRVCATVFVQQQEASNA